MSLLRSFTSATATFAGRRAPGLASTSASASASSALFARASLSTSSNAAVQLQSAIEAALPREIAKIKEIKAAAGDTVIGTCTVEQAYGGMRDVESMVTETSLLDAQDGIRFRGLSIPELQAQLPAASASGEPLPEGLFWLMLTGRVPSADEVAALSHLFAERSSLPAGVAELIDAFPRDMHPMSQFSAAVLLLQPQSRMAAAYQEGVKKTELWKYALDDSLTLIAQLPVIAARIYRNAFHAGAGRDVAVDPALDWSANYARLLGFDEKFDELMRLYMTIHTDHEGGNVSAHATHLVGSALSDPFLSFSAGMNGLAGPLHGLANQEVLRWTVQMWQTLGGGDNIANERLEEECWKTLKAGRVIPGFGHAVLRKTDPRYTVQREFGLKHFPNDPLFKLVCQIYEVVPDVLARQGKTKNPWPNVDAISGTLLQYHGLKEERYYTVMFGVSRALGVLASLVWDRALGLPIERPKSTTTDALYAKFVKGQH